MDLLIRAKFALSAAWQQRSCLFSWKNSALHQINTILDLSPVALQQMGIRFLVLDFDGVLASHGELEPCSEVLVWLRNWTRNWPADHIAILSNKPLLARQLFFSTHFPDIQMREARLPKPYPQGLEDIAVQRNIPLSQVALLDDRWLTGMLAAALAGAEGIYIKRPYVNFSKRPVKEAFFMILRGTERAILWAAFLVTKATHTFSGRL